MSSETRHRFKRTSGVLLPVVILLAAIALAAGQVAPAAAPVPAPVEIRVHVFDGGRFVDTLSLKDFEVLENGVPQPVDALCLVNGQTVGRKEGSIPFEPALARSFYLLFQTVDWDPRLGEAVHYLFSRVLRPGDMMTLVTPWKPYSLQKDALAMKSKEALSSGMQNLLRKDIEKGGGEYRDVIKTMKRIRSAIDGAQNTIGDELEMDGTESDFGLQQQLDMYRTSIKRLESIRLVDETKLMAFADALKARPGQKTVYFFYQREFRPELSPMTMQILLSQYQDDPTVQGNLMDLFQYYRREATFNSDRVKKAFSDAGILFHFIFMDKTSERLAGGTMHEQSEDIFPGFRDIAAATGGMCETSHDPAASFERAAAASESSYLLRYVPGEAAARGDFRMVQVKVRAKSPAGRDYSVLAPMGYYAR